MVFNGWIKCKMIQMGSGKKHVEDGEGERIFPLCKQVRVFKDGLNN